MQYAIFDGRTYLHPMIAERQREVSVSIKALRMMQEHHGNPYFSFLCVSDAEEADWRAKAELIVPPVIAGRDAAAKIPGDKIVTTFVHPPIPDRRFDWCAHRDNDEPNDSGSMLQGFGRTEQEAIDDLVAQIEDVRG